MTPDAWIRLGSAAFVVTHVGMTHPPVRAAQIAALGRGPYLLVYSAVSMLTFVPTAWVWWTHPHAGAAWWALRGGGWTALSVFLATAGLAIAVGGLATPAPSSFERAKVLVADTIDVRGMTAVTRHPVFIGSGLLGVAHLIGNGWSGDVAWWGAFPVIAAAGAWHQDLRKAAESPAYRRFMSETSVIPFGRPDQLGKVGVRAWIGAAVGVAVALGLRALHG